MSLILCIHVCVCVCVCACVRGCVILEREVTMLREEVRQKDVALQER